LKQLLQVVSGEMQADETVRHRVFLYMLANNWNLEWTPLDQIGKALDGGLAFLPSAFEHDYRFDLHFDLTSVRLRAASDLPASLSSKPDGIVATAWLDRIYHYLTTVHGCHDDERGVLLEQVERDVVRPLSLHSFVPLRTIILADTERLELRFPVGKNRIFLKNGVPLVPQTTFEVFIRENPIYFLRFAGACGSSLRPLGPGNCSCAAVIFKSRVKACRSTFHEYENSQEKEVWRNHEFVGNYALLHSAEYRALIMGLHECSANFYLPLVIEASSTSIIQEMLLNASREQKELSSFELLPLAKQVDHLLLLLKSKGGEGSITQMRQIKQEQNQAAIDEAERGMAEGMMKARGWHSKLYLPTERAEDWTVERQFFPAVERDSAPLSIGLGQLIARKRRPVLLKTDRRTGLPKQSKEAKKISSTMSGKWW